MYVLTNMHMSTELAVEFLKTYQVWHHHRLLVTIITRKAKEKLDFIQKGLKVDKNYHTVIDNGSWLTLVVPAKILLLLPPPLTPPPPPPLPNPPLQTRTNNLITVYGMES